MTSGVAAARRAVAALALAALAWGVPVFAEEADRELYAGTLSRERALRATFSGTPATERAFIRTPPVGTCAGWAGGTGSGIR